MLSISMPQRRAIADTSAKARGPSFGAGSVLWACRGGRPFAETP